MFGYHLIGARNFFERLQSVKEELTDFAGSRMPDTALPLGRAHDYICAQDNAREFLTALNNIKRGAKIFCGDILIVKDYEDFSTDSPVSLSGVEKFVAGLDDLITAAVGL